MFCEAGIRKGSGHMSYGTSGNAENYVDINNELDYEKDSRFIAYMKLRLATAVKDREAGKLVNSDVVFADIRDKYGW
jgi:hypothetical protein